MKFHQKKILKLHDMQIIKLFKNNGKEFNDNLLKVEQIKTEINTKYFQI